MTAKDKLNEPVMPTMAEDLSAARDRDYGFSCWHCPAQFNCGDVTPRVAEDMAGAAGWVIGTFEGQGNIACPDCSSTLWHPILLGTREGRRAKAEEAA